MRRKGEFDREKRVEKETVGNFATLAYQAVIDDNQGALEENKFFDIFD